MLIQIRALVEALSEARTTPQRQLPQPPPHRLQNRHQRRGSDRQNISYPVSSYEEGHFSSHDLEEAESELRETI